MNKNFIPVMVINIDVLNNFVLRLTFSDGITKNIDMTVLMDKEITKPLKNLNYFKQVKIDDFGGIYWPNNYDICPDFLRYYI
ncbi:MAG: DUF2442 domain-containing protein [Bacteroidia bacterium]|nr:DUF2442 domain-containing protein [Bacteroidia bacterium]